MAWARVVGQAEGELLPVLAELDVEAAALAGALDVIGEGLGLEGEHHLVERLVPLGHVALVEDAFSPRGALDGLEVVVAYLAVGLILGQRCARGGFVGSLLDFRLRDRSLGLWLQGLGGRRPGRISRPLAALVGPARRRLDGDRGGPGLGHLLGQVEVGLRGGVLPRGAGLVEGEGVLGDGTFVTHGGGHLRRGLALLLLHGEIGLGLAGGVLPEGGALASDQVVEVGGHGRAHLDSGARHPLVDVEDPLRDLGKEALKLGARGLPRGEVILEAVGQGLHGGAVPALVFSGPSGPVPVPIPIFDAHGALEFEEEGLGLGARLGRLARVEDDRVGELVHGRAGVRRGGHLDEALEGVADPDLHRGAGRALGNGGLAHHRAEDLRGKGGIGHLVAGHPELPPPHGHDSGAEVDFLVAPAWGHVLDAGSEVFARDLAGDVPRGIEGLEPGGGPARVRLG